MLLTSSGKEGNETFDLVGLDRQERLAAAINEVQYVNFGPCQIMPEAWKWLKLATGAHGKNPLGKEVTFALLGQLKTNYFIVKGFIQLSGESGRDYSLFAAEDLKKIESEASKQELSLIGILHTHIESLKPSPQDRLAWLSLMFEFDRPLLYFILQLNPLKLTAYSIPPDIFTLLKESIKFVEYEVKDSD